ncbi:MAG: UDPGP type 1 family protein [Lachnospiraceae bacterium]|nr:UDPGP type 1 family protein [Lachnospiraceae bacterium]
MDYSRIKEKLEKYDQLQLLRFYEELSEEEKEILLTEIDNIDFDLINGEEFIATDGDITPIEVMTLNEIAKSEEEFRSYGIEAIQNHKVAAVLLAGGQGTRLGIDGPKGALNVGLTKELYIFQCLVQNLMKVKEEAGTWLPLLIMTSDKNDKETRDFFEAHDYFGYNREYVNFFVQEMAPATDRNGKVYLEEKGHISLSPNGNGGWFVSMQKAGLLEKVKAMGVEWINIFAVDNVLQQIADPVFVGATLKSGQPIGAKVIRKAAPEEKVGVLCLKNGHPSIVEYYDLTEDMMVEKADNGELAYNFGVILNYLFKVKDLETIANQQLPLHIVNKKVPYIDDDGNYVKPEEPNGHKYENLVLDMIEMMSGCLGYEVVREKEFAPIKNMHGVDSLDSAREMLSNNGVEL